MIVGLIRNKYASSHAINQPNDVDTSEPVARDTIYKVVI